MFGFDFSKVALWGVGKWFLLSFGVWCVWGVGCLGCRAVIKCAVYV